MVFNRYRNKILAPKHCILQQEGPKILGEMDFREIYTQTFMHLTTAVKREGKDRLNIEADHCRWVGVEAGLINKGTYRKGCLRWLQES